MQHIAGAIKNFLKKTNKKEDKSPKKKEKSNSAQRKNNKDIFLKYFPEVKTEK